MRSSPGARSDRSLHGMNRAHTNGTPCRHGHERPWMHMPTTRVRRPTTGDTGSGRHGRPHWNAPSGNWSAPGGCTTIARCGAKGAAVVEDLLQALGPYSLNDKYALDGRDPNTLAVWDGSWSFDCAGPELIFGRLHDQRQHSTETRCAATSNAGAPLPDMAQRALLPETRCGVAGAESIRPLSSRPPDATASPDSLSRLSTSSSA